MSSGSTAVFDRTQHRRASLRKSSAYFMLFLPVELCEDEAQETHPKSTNITEELLVPGPALQKSVGFYTLFHPEVFHPCLRFTSSPDFNHLPHLTDTTARPLAPHPRYRTRPYRKEIAYFSTPHTLTFRRIWVIPSSKTILKSKRQRAASSILVHTELAGAKKSPPRRSTSHSWAPT